ncbi:ABC transporter substrate-binding protein [Hyphomicrobium sp.]|uniref:ABC transporter substrate-binding protein n=1 Tax=Hyphomicrobium sp. TaxID=82 RepID=UPI001DA74939|nr:ABC transporter substrate-binding protein [Hyphomicrobium sp.]MBY0558908.1 ABC transporter substrate-binding protein [Hyphomicrobium sp.]
MIRKFTRALAIVTAASGFAAAASAGDWKPESADPIKLTINEWTGQTITTHIAGKILKNMGYNVEYVVAGYFPQMTALQDGSVTAALEIWTTNIGDAYDKAIATKNVVDVGGLGIKPVETWFYPAYMEETCPGLPDWKALKNCSAVFATPDTAPDGRFLDYPADWGTTNKDRIKALDLPFVAIPAGSEGAIVAEIKSAFAKKTPLLVMWYKPHWVYGKYDLRQVELPPYQDGCFDKPEIGLNPNATYDCDFVRGDVRKVAWVGMAEKWPAAVKLISSLHITNDEQIEMITKIDEGGASLDAVTTDWLAANEKTWKGWVADAEK